MGLLLGWALEQRSQIIQKVVNNPPISIYSFQEKILKQLLHYYQKNEGKAPRIPK